MLLTKAVAAVIRGAGPHTRRLSSYVIADALKYWYSEDKLCPRGISVFAECVQDWALRTGQAIRKMAASFIDCFFVAAVVSSNKCAGILAAVL